MVELLSTKLYIPRVRANLVPRPHLTERLNAGLDKKLTLIAAPAGFGKTTLLSEWIPQSPRCVTWLSLDKSDNDPIQFWTYFIASLQRLRPDLGSGVLELIQSPQTPPLPSVLTTLINELIAFPDNFAIVLDDYHFIEYKPVHQSLTYLIEHQPANMHLVITTRVDPPLPLARLRARNNLTEIRVKDLRFRADEAAAFMKDIMSLELSTDDVIALEERTEGWIAGLQIAALSMHAGDETKSFIHAFSGSHRHIVGYLADEVINQQPNDIVEFLVRTSILERLCGPLCDAVTGKSGGQQVLESLERANLFITTLDDEGEWYRYHHLFADVLKFRLVRSQREVVPELHRRARKWFEQNGWIHEAVYHAISGQDFEQAAYLIEKIVSQKWKTGELKTLEGWLAALPEEAWSNHPRLWLVQAWIAMSLGDLDRGDFFIRAAEESYKLLDKEVAKPLNAEILAIRASHASLMQDPRAVELAEHALNELPPDYWLRGMLVVFLSAGYYSTGDLKAALKALEQDAGADSRQDGQQLHRVHLLAFTGTVYYAQGKLNKALDYIHRAIELAEPGGNPIPFVGTLLAYMSISPILFERNDIEKALMYSNRCLAMAENFGSFEVQVYILSLMASIYVALNKVGKARALFHRIDRILLEHNFSPSIMAYIEYRRFLLLIKEDNINEASAWMHSHADPAGKINPYAFHRLAQAQLLIKKGELSTAQKYLDDLVYETGNSGHGNLLIKALIFQAITFYEHQNPDRAYQALERALILAEPEGYIRSFVDEGERMYDLLLDYQTDCLERSPLEPGDQPSRLLRMISNLLGHFAANKEEHHQLEGLTEALSERELEILSLIAIGYSNKEIAERLVIAVSTVKSHINNLYGKLGTQRRTHAVAIARERGLITEF